MTFDHVYITLKNGAEWHPTGKDVRRWQAAYPGVDVFTELLKMQAWCDANPQRRKTERGIGRFVVNWLGSAKPRAATSTRSRTLHDDLTDTSWAK